MDPVIRVEYKLTENARKADLAAGGNGEENRVFMFNPPFPSSILELTHPDGGHWTAKLPDKIFENTQGGGVSLDGEVEEAGVKKSVHVGRYYQFSNWQIRSYEDWYEYHADHILTRDEISLYTDKIISELNNKIAEFGDYETAQKRARDAAAAELPALLEIEKQKVREAICLEIRLEEERAETATRKEASKAKMETERTAWIQHYGSERLKLCLEGEYPLNSLYLEERVEHELGEGWKVDTKDQAETETKSCPSLNALQAVKALPEGFTGEVVWLTVPPSTINAYGFEPCEAVKVTAPFTNHDIYTLFDC